MELNSFLDDPDKDSDVPALIWEIRRERRMEFVLNIRAYWISSVGKN